MSWLTQIIAVTFLNLRTLRQRAGSSAVAVVGIAGVVIVLVAVLSMAEGFFAAMTASPQPWPRQPLRTPRCSASARVP